MRHEILSAVDEFTRVFPRLCNLRLFYIYVFIYIYIYDIILDRIDNGERTDL